MTTQSGAGGAASPAELGYVQVTASQANIGTAATDLTGLTLTVVVGTRALLLMLYITSLSCNTANSYVVADIVDVTAGNVQIVGGSAQVPLVNNGSSLCVAIRVNPGAGSRTYKAQAQAGAGLATLNAGATFPAWMEIREV